MRDDRRFWVLMAVLALLIFASLILIVWRMDAVLPRGAEIPGPDSGKAALAPVAGMGRDAPWSVVRTANLPPGDDTTQNHTAVCRGGYDPPAIREENA